MHADLMYFTFGNGVEPLYAPDFADPLIVATVAGGFESSPSFEELSTHP